MILGGHAPARASTPVAQRYVMASWTQKEGLFGSVKALAQDHLGYLWLGTENGLFRFDGIRFERFHSTDGPAFPKRDVVCLWIAPDHSLWVGFTSGGGVSRIRDGRVTTYGHREGMDATLVWSILEDSQGTLWAASREGLFRFVNERWQLAGAATGLPAGSARTLYVDGVGTFWVTTSRGLFKRDDSRDVFVLVDPDVALFADISASALGVMWLTDHRRGGVRTLDKSAHLPLPHSERDNSTILHDRLGNLWVAALGLGLWFGAHDDAPPKAMDRVGPDDGLPTDGIRCLFEDSEGHIWVGTQIGLFQLSPRRVTHISDLGTVRSIAIAADGTAWVGTANGLGRLSGSARRWYGVDDGLPSASIRALYIDDSGTLWVGAAGGLSRLANDRFVIIDTGGGVAPKDINWISRDPGGSVWVRDNALGMLRWIDRGFVAFDPSPDVSHHIITSVMFDPRGQLWMTLLGGGVAVMAPGGHLRIARESDDTAGTDLAIYQDQAGTIWFAGGDRLSRAQDGRLSSVTHQNGLPEDPIVSIVTDDFEHVWLGTNAGIVRLSKKDFDDAVLDPTSRFAISLYDSIDGLMTMPVRGLSRSAGRDRNGTLWFTVGNGVAVIDPRRALPPATGYPSTPAHIERIIANGASVPASSAVVLPPRTMTLQIDYTALTLRSSQKVTFRYRLDGFDDQWVDAGTRRQAFYTNLPPKQYRFEVLARSSEGLWSTQAAGLDLVIVPAFYQTAKFFVGCGVVGALVIAGGWRMRLRQIQSRMALVIGERARLSREIHDALLQNLVGVALLLGAASNDSGSSSAQQEQLTSLRRRVEQLIREARQLIWGLRQADLGKSRHDQLVTALRLAGEQGTHGGGPVRFNLAVSGLVRPFPPKVEEHVLRVGQEAIHNAVRHANASQVNVTLHYYPDALRLCVADDGRGFKADPDATGIHCGIAIMHERAQLVDGLLEIVSQPGEGTTVALAVPFSSRAGGALG